MELVFWPFIYIPNTLSHHFNLYSLSRMTLSSLKVLLSVFPNADHILDWILEPNLVTHLPS